jgi:transcriptional regulator with XRE-family HTH domain
VARLLDHVTHESPITFAVGSGTTSGGIFAAYYEDAQQTGRTARAFLTVAIAGLIATGATSTATSPGSLACNRAPQLFDIGPEVANSENNLTTRALNEIKQKLRLTVAHLARALRVERPTVYQWLQGSQPRTVNAARIAALSNFAEQWRAAGLGSARASWEMRPTGTQQSLGELLTADSLDADALQALVKAMSRAPASLERVKPPRVFGFPRDQSESAPRRLDDLFAPSASDED